MNIQLFNSSSLNKNTPTTRSDIDCFCDNSYNLARGLDGDILRKADLTNRDRNTEANTFTKPSYTTPQLKVSDKAFNELNPRREEQPDIPRFIVVPRNNNQSQGDPLEPEKAFSKENHTQLFINEYSNQSGKSPLAGRTISIDLPENSAPPELEYSGSFNSASTKSRNSDNNVIQGYSEESRLLRISASKSDNKIRSSDDQLVTNLPQSKSHHRPSTIISNSNCCIMSKNNLSVHANLGELLSKGKMLEQAQRDANPNMNMKSPRRGPSTRTTNANATISRPESLSNRAKTTGMITRQQEPFDDEYAQIQATLSGSLMPAHKQQTQYSFGDSSKNPKAITPTRTNGSVQAPTTSFQDPKIVDNLQHSNQTLNNRESFTDTKLTQKHPLIHSNSMPPSRDDPLTEFDPFSESLSSPQSRSHSIHYHKEEQGQGQHRLHQSAPCIDTTQLSELAAALSSLKPQQPNSNEAETKRIGSNKLHRRLLSLKSPKNMNVDDTKEMNHSSFNFSGNLGIENDSDPFEISIESTAEVRDKKEGKKHKRASSLGFFKRNVSYDEDDPSSSRPTTPSKGLRRNKSNGSKADEDVGKSSGLRKLSLRIGKSHSRNNSSTSNNSFLSDSIGKGISPDHSPTRENKVHLETIDSLHCDSDNNLKPRLHVSTSGEIKLRSSEQDPSPHQISIPPVSEALMQAKLCHVMELYRQVDQNFDFGNLVEVPRHDMEMFLRVRPTTPSQASSRVSPLSSSGENLLFQPVTTLATSPTNSLHSLVPVHRPIVESILSTARDMVVAAFYYDINQSENTCPCDRTEVAIFASDELRQFVVVFQGSSENQNRPIRNRIGKFNNKPTKNFGDDKSLSVLPSFEQGYTSSGLEKRVFQKLDELAEQYPFFDVIMTGHSYGAVLALLASTRYASSKSALMVSCYAFGCPKVGALDFRYYVNSLPNLRVMRIEYGCDPWVHAPDHPNWTHAGHTMSILPHEHSSKEKDDFLVRAYKFDNHCPDSPANTKYIGKKGNRQEKQVDHDISSYLEAIEIISNDIFAWPTKFMGEEGFGVQGLNSEKRLVC